jgi:hypothetical protein
MCEIREYRCLCGTESRGRLWRKPSLYPRIRDHPAGVGFRNYFPIENHAYSACSQVAIETLIHQTSAYRGLIGTLKRRTGIRLAARTMAGAHISEAAAPITMLLRVITPSWLEIGAVIVPSQSEGWRRPATLAVETATSHLRGNHLATAGRLVRAPGLPLMNPSCSVGLGDYNQAQHVHDQRNSLLLKGRGGAVIAWSLCDGDRACPYRGGDAEPPLADSPVCRALSLLWLC